MPVYGQFVERVHCCWGSTVRRSAGSTRVMFARDPARMGWPCPSTRPMAAGAALADVCHAVGAIVLF